jgi:hypothetical protein
MLFLWSENCKEENEQMDTYMTSEHYADITKGSTWASWLNSLEAVGSATELPEDFRTSLDVDKYDFNAGRVSPESPRLREYLGLPESVSREVMRKAREEYTRWFPCFGD